MPKRPSDQHGALSKRARTETHPAPISTPSTDSEVAHGLQRLINAYMMERTGCTASLTVLVHQREGGSAGASSGQGGTDSSPPSQGGSTGGRCKRGGADASSVSTSKPGPVEPEATKHQCLRCPQNFTRSNDLKRHDLFHSGEKPHSCRICTKAFSLGHHLKRHERTHRRKR
jgi:uncharacterized Zn-finger protein